LKKLQEKLNIDQYWKWIIDDLEEGIILVDKAFNNKYNNNTVNKIFGLKIKNAEKLQVQDLLIIKCDEQSSQSFSKDKMKI
jgi:predicted oxidoreductase